MTTFNFECVGSVQASHPNGGPPESGESPGVVEVDADAMPTLAMLENVARKNLKSEMRVDKELFNFFSCPTTSFMN